MVNQVVFGCTFLRRMVNYVAIYRVIKRKYQNQNSSSLNSLTIIDFRLRRPCSCPRRKYNLKSTFINLIPIRTPRSRRCSSPKPTIFASVCKGHR